MVLTFLTVFFGCAIIAIGVAISDILGSASDARVAQRRRKITDLYCLIVAEPEDIEDAHLIFTDASRTESAYNEFIEDFVYVFGKEKGESTLRNLLRVHTRGPYIYENYEKWQKDSEHDRRYVRAHTQYWLFHLILASKGRLDDRVFTEGFRVSNSSNEERDIKFMQCIEKRLQKKHPSLRFVLRPVYGVMLIPTSGEFVLEQVVIPGTPTKRCW